MFQDDLSSRPFRLYAVGVHFRCGGRMGWHCSTSFPTTIDLNAHRGRQWIHSTYKKFSPFEGCRSSSLAQLPYFITHDIASKKKNVPRKISKSRFLFPLLPHPPFSMGGPGRVYGIIIIVPRVVQREINSILEQERDVHNWNRKLDLLEGLWINITWALLHNNDQSMVYSVDVPAIYIVVIVCPISPHVVTFLFQVHDIHLRRRQRKRWKKRASSVTWYFSSSQIHTLPGKHWKSIRRKIGRSRQHILINREQLSPRAASTRWKLNCFMPVRRFFHSFPPPK